MIEVEGGDSSKMKSTFSSCDATLPKPSLSCGKSGQVRPLRAQSGKGLTACPAESEHLKRRSTTLKYYKND
ncbi:hypothetical protein P8610_18750 [Fictibacillus sp. UD]